MIVSIVTGTFNRLNHLSTMVLSVRRSIGVGIPYEIIVVDGGSIDDTIPWCMNQPDVNLILHGELLGAVKAFNDGAAAATGRYVILANDDIEFIGDSILYAIRHMEENPMCGVGCFYQDRGNNPFHVDLMPAVQNGKQISAHYGQVCIVPKSIGDYVGWWGNYLHTYGGDNELSANVLEAGWTVEPIECACVHDTTVQDDLRRINNDDPRELAKQGKSHPDSTKFYKKWTENGLVGPHIGRYKDSVGAFPKEELTRFVYLPIYEPGHPIQRIQKSGLRDALARYGIVREIDYVHSYKNLGRQYTIDYAFDMFEALQPHIALFQLHGADIFTAKDIRFLKSRFPNTKFVNWNGDYHKDQLENRQYINLLKEFDLATVVTTEVYQIYSLHGINWRYWQIGWEGSDIEDTSDVPSHDIVFLGNGYSRERLALAKFLRSLPYDVGLYGFWPENLRPNGVTTYDFDTGYKLYKNAKIAIGDSQWPDATGFVSNRLFQALYAGGAVLFHQWFDGCEKLLGLKDGEHLVLWNDFKHLEDLLFLYLSHNGGVVDSLGKKISEAGSKEVRENHSFDARVKELINML